MDTAIWSFGQLMPLDTHKKGGSGVGRLILFMKGNWLVAIQWWQKKSMDKIPFSL